MEKRFVLRLIAFVLPFALASLLAFIQAFLIGEAAPFRLVLEWQEKAETPLAYQPAWSRGQFFDYKLTAIAARKPEILVLGSSRVTFYRAAFATKDPHAFYNAGVPNMSIGEVSRFFETVVAEGYTPQIIILGLDFPDFNAERGDFRRTVGNIAFPSLKDNFVWTFTGVKRLGQQWLSDFGASFSPETDNYQLLGLQSFARNEGFLGDGSRFVAGRTEETFAQNLAGDMETFANRESYFRGGSTVDSVSLAALDKILALAKAKDIAVIAYLPSYRPSVWLQMEESGDYAYMPLALAAIEESFASQDFPFYDFTDPAAVGGSESEMTDTWHGMDLLSMRMYREFLYANPEILGAYSDLAVLDGWLRDYADMPLAQFAIRLP
jgi:hypothetical protein